MGGSALDLQLNNLILKAVDSWQTSVALPFVKIEGCELWTRTFPPSPLQPSPPFASHHHISTLVDEQGPRWNGTNYILMSASCSESRMRVLAGCRCVSTRADNLSPPFPPFPPPPLPPP
jgi:hypothetical protein